VFFTQHVSNTSEATSWCLGNRASKAVTFSSRHSFSLVSSTSKNHNTTAFNISHHGKALDPSMPGCAAASCLSSYPGSDSKNSPFNLSLFHPATNDLPPRKRTDSKPKPSASAPSPPKQPHTPSPPYEHPPASSLQKMSLFRRESAHTAQCPAPTSPPRVAMPAKRSKMTASSLRGSSRSTSTMISAR